MPDQLPIPNPDVIPVPGDIGMILFLLYLTFFVHVVLMNILVGGTFLTFVSEMISKFSSNDQKRSLHEHLSEKLGHIMPFMVSMTITFGIAPLLFVQGIYGQFFYTSSVLMATVWLSVVLLILIGYYSLYFYTRGFEKYKNRRYIFISISMVMFAVVAFIYVNNLTLMQTPQKWLAIYTNTNGSGWYLNTDEITLIPRYLHIALSAVAVSGLLVLYLGMREKTNEQLKPFAIRWGAIWFIVPTLLQIGVGLWFYYAIPENLRSIFSQGTPALLFHSSHVLFFIGTVCIALSAIGKHRNIAAWLGIITVLVGVLGKIINRDQLRQAYLREVNWTLDVLKTAPQYDVIALFFISLLAGIGLLIWVLRKYQKEVKANSPK
ncbi:hypothetical protein F9K33_12295 [bacterium]|nr:MAG: hypothetical protein F9K33_12295 [bacterium]